MKLYLHRRHQHYKHRKHSLPSENSGGRRQSNGDGATSGGGRRVSIQPEDATLEVNILITFFDNRIKKINILL